tara:strand:- start:9815 stop:11173 length:1359 start_codon:yes stop_codon:yes gene_type:complete
MKKNQSSIKKNLLKRFSNLFERIKSTNSFISKNAKSYKKNFPDNFLRSKKYNKLIKLISDYKLLEFSSKKLNKAKDKYTLIEKIKKTKNQKVRTNKKTKPTNNFSLFEKIKNSDSYIYLIKKISEFKIIDENFKSKINRKNEKFNQKIGILFYADHKLIIASLNINLKNQININNVTEIPIPGNVIGDSLVEDINELANISLDSINLLDLSTSPLLVILSSSYFTIHTFASSDLKQISLNDSKVQSKSPFLAANTLVEFCKVSDENLNSDDYVRTVYANKELINSWTNTLEIIDLPIIGLVPASTHIFDAISNNVKQELSILIDIESNITTLLIGTRSAKLTSYKLPFGSSLYISNDPKKSLNNYFERVINSVNLLLEESDHSLPDNIYVMGHGLDELGVNSSLLPGKFKNISSLNLAEYYYSPDKMEVHELVSKSIESNIDSITSVLRLCV